MTTKQIVKQALAYCDLSNAELARRLDWSPQLLSKRLSTGKLHQKNGLLSEKPSASRSVSIPLRWNCNSINKKTAYAVFSFSLIRILATDTICCIVVIYISQILIFVCFYQRFIIYNVIIFAYHNIGDRYNECNYSTIPKRQHLKQTQRLLIEHLRLQGHSTRDIADVVGCSHVTRNL